MAIKRIDHTAVVVSDLDEAISRWQMMTGARLGSRDLIPEQKVEVAMLEIGDTTIELIRPVDAQGGVARFLAKHGESLHHIGLEVDDIDTTIAELTGAGLDFVDAQPRTGVHGLVAFMHPRSTGGVLLELIERSSRRGRSK